MAVIEMKKGIERKFNPFFYARAAFEIGCLNFNAHNNVQTLIVNYFC